LVFVSFGFVKNILVSIVSIKFFVNVQLHSCKLHMHHMITVITNNQSRTYASLSTSQITDSVAGSH